MKKYLLLFLSGTILSVNLAFAQPATDVKTADSLPRFNLDFPGGTPRQLVQAVQKTSGKPLNAVIPNEDANLKLPALSVKNVTTPELFKALELSSQKTEAYITGNTFVGVGGQQRAPSYQFSTSNYGFKTDGPPNENSIWYFFRNKPPVVPGLEPVEVPIICRFYQLVPYLDAGYKVEDITTAIETGWKMLGETSPPKISYHKDTKLLIAVGEESKLGLIQDVLNHLVMEKPKAKSADTQNSENPKGK